MNDDEIMATWRAVVARIDHAVERALADPEFARARGWSVTADRGPADLGHFQRGDRLPPLPQEVFLRAAAREIMPPGFDYEVLLTVGGPACLVLKGVKDPSLVKEVRGRALFEERA